MDEMNVDLDGKYPLIPAKDCSQAWAVVADWKNEGPPTSEPIIWCASKELAEEMRSIFRDAKESNSLYAVEVEGGSIRLEGEEYFPDRELQSDEWDIPTHGVEGWEFRFYYNIKKGVAENHKIAISVRDALDKMQ